MNKPANFERDAFYSIHQVGDILGISIRSIGDACRAGELQFTLRASRRFFKGQWLIEWLEGHATQNQPTASSRESSPA